MYNFTWNISYKYFIYIYTFKSSFVLKQLFKNNKNMKQIKGLFILDIKNIFQT